jgi:hypothetical protein
MKMFVFWCPQVARQFSTPIRFPAMKQGLVLDYEGKEKQFTE